MMAGQAMLPEPTTFGDIDEGVIALNLAADDALSSSSRAKLLLSQGFLSSGG
jgi:hypothetical protein